MRVLICGSVDFRWNFVIYERMKKFDKDTVIIEGEARGADTIARNCAERMGLQVLKFPADWNKYGKAAGPIRNKQMIDEGKPDLVLAFYSEESKSRGTKNTVTQALKAGIPVETFDASKEL